MSVPPTSDSGRVPPFHLTSGPDSGLRSRDRKMQAAITSKLTWRLVPLLFLLYVVAYVDRINIGFAGLQLRSRLALTDAGFGFAAGVFFAGYVVFQLPSNMVLERVGARRWIALLMVAWGIVSSTLIFVKSVKQLCALRFLLGSAEAGFFPGIVFYLKGWFPTTARARTLALFAAGGPVSAIIAGPLSGAFLNIHRAGLAGWQWMFLLEGVPAVFLGIGVFLYLTNRPTEASWLSSEERDWLVGALAQENEGPPRRSGRGISRVLASASVWLLVAVYFGVNSAGYGITFWLPSFIRSLSGVSTLAIGLISTVPYTAALIVMVLVGSHADRSGEHRWHIAGPAVLGAVALVSAGYTSSVTRLIAALSLAVVAEFSMVGPFWALATTVEPEYAAVGIALINSIGNLGGLAGSYAIGALNNSSTGFRHGLVLLGMGLGITGCMALLVPRPDHRFARSRAATATVM